MLRYRRYESVPAAASSRYRPIVGSCDQTRHAGRPLIVRHQMKRFLETLIAVVLCVVALTLSLAGWDFTSSKPASKQPAPPETAKG